MSWKGQRSRISFRNLLRNKKTALIAVLCCVVAVGAYAAYVGLHKPTSEAGNPEPYKGVLNYDENSGFSLVNFTGNSASAPSAQPIDLSKKVGNKGNGDAHSWGTPENPFMILELTPWQGFSEMGFMIEGCEPVDVFSKAGVYDKEKAAYYRKNGEEDLYDTYLGTTGGLSWANMGAVVKECFPDEEYPGKGTQKGDADYKYRWFHKTGEKTIKGYYECVKSLGEGYEGNFSITGIDEKGRPIFSKSDEGDFVWISLGGEAPNYDFHKQKENKHFKEGSTLEDVINAYAAGDREYTNRTDDEYYFMPNVYQVDEDGTVYEGNDLKPKSKFVHYNDYLRYTMRERTMKAVDEFCVVIKPVDPVELNAHPEWIDYTDLTYLHISSESGIANNHTKGATELQTYNKALLTTKQNENSSFYTEGNDLSWEVAEKLYLKANGLAKYEYDENGEVTKTVYDYTGSDQFGYAPVIIGKTIIDTLNGGTTHNNPTYYMNYETMQIQKTVPSGEGNVSTTNTGRNNNFYKFCLMDLLMDQDVFYDLFYRPIESTGQPIIQTQKVNGVETGVSVAQEGDAQYFWCPATFLPYVEKIVQNYGWETEDGKKLKDKYGINQYGNAFMNFPGEAIVGYTYIYNSNNTIFVLGTSANLGKDAEYSGGAFEWFEEERDESYDTLSTLDIIHFLLNYKKGIRTVDTDRKELKLRVLDIEPCSDYSYLTATALRALFPVTKYKVSFKITHMTTAELNGNKASLLANYDVIYVGTGVSKYNLADGKTVFNDERLNARTYVHVGDTVKGKDGEDYRTSGNDLTKLKQQEIEEFVKAGKVVLLDTQVYAGNVKVVSKGTNMRNLAANIAQKKYKNVVSLDQLRISNTVEFMVGKAEIKMKSTPPAYRNAESGDNQLEAIKADEDGKYRLTFTFTMGYEASKDETYAARFLIDRNGDGVVSDKEEGGDVVDTWNAESKSGNLFTPASIKTPMLDENGDEIIDEETHEKVYEEAPMEYSISYVIPENFENGPIAWKFVLYATGNKAICYEWTGVSRYTGYTGPKVEGGLYTKDGKRITRILHITDAEDIYGKNNLELEIADKEKREAIKENLEDTKESDGLFNKYGKKKLEDYAFEITTIPLTGSIKRSVLKDKKYESVSTDGYVDAFQKAAQDKDARYVVEIGGKEYYYPAGYVGDYDLYLFDCGEALEKADNSNGAVSFASWLADSGYSVVFTADSVYDENAAKASGVLSALKDSTGLSRFTAKSKYARKHVDTPYNHAGNEYSKNIANMEYTYHKAFVNAGSGNQYKSYSNELWKDASGTGEPSFGNESGLSTTEVTMTNLGTLSVYPYTIGTVELPLAKAQDYQLNLENPEATVWYSLGKTNAKGTDNSYYTISPNDASNNYYMYTVGNVCYCGIDLSKVKADSDQEMKLFVNSLIFPGYVSPSIDVDRVYNRETDLYEIGPKNKENKPELATKEEQDKLKVKKEDDENKKAEKRKKIYALLDRNSVDPVESESPLPTESGSPLYKAGVEKFADSLITTGDTGKSLNYKLYQMPTDPANDDTLIWSGGSVFDPKATGAPNTEQLADDAEKDPTEENPDKVIKNAYFDSATMNWPGTTQIAAADLNAMKASDELRIYYSCSEEIMKNNIIGVDVHDSQDYNKVTRENSTYEMTSEDRLFELIIGYDSYGNKMSDYIYADDKAAQTHCISFTKGQLEDYIIDLAKRKNVKLVPNSEGEFIFYDIVLKKVDGRYDNKGWGTYDYWENGKQYYVNITNPLNMASIAIYEEDAGAGNSSVVKSVVENISKDDLDSVDTDGKIKGDTHRIYFTPDAGSPGATLIENLSIEYYRTEKPGNQGKLVRTRIIENGKPKRCPITEVYQEIKDADGNVTGYKKISNPQGEYSGVLKSGTQYFLTYDKKMARTTAHTSEGDINIFQYIQFEIFNAKKSSKAVLHLEPELKKAPEDVYLFNLD